MRRAISLVALVITIVVLIILTGTVILTMGVQDNVVNKAQKAKDNNNLTTAQDKLLIELASLKVQSSEENEKVIEYIVEDSVKEKLQKKYYIYSRRKYS